MSEDRKVANVLPQKSLNVEDLPEVLSEEQELELEARVATVLDRGMASSYLDVPNLPDHLYGEWVFNDAIDIDRLRKIGFKVDTKYASALHGAGDGAKTVGDVIFMTAPQAVKRAIDSVRAKKYEEMHGKRNSEGVIEGTKEERDLKANVSHAVIDESSDMSVNEDAIRDAFTHKD